MTNGIFTTCAADILAFVFSKKLLVLLKLHGILEHDSFCLDTNFFYLILYNMNIISPFKTRAYCLRLSCVVTANVLAT